MLFASSDLICLVDVSVDYDLNCVLVVMVRAFFTGA